MTKYFISEMNIYRLGMDRRLFRHTILDTTRRGYWVDRDDPLTSMITLKMPDWHRRIPTIVRENILRVSDNT